MTRNPTIIGFLCHWCAYAAADLAGSSRLSCAASFKPVRVMCTGRVDPSLVLQALEQGADGVIVAGCRAGDCHYHGGNCQAAFRMNLLRRLMEQTGRDPRRLRLIWLGAGEAKKLMGEIAKMTQQLMGLARADPPPVSPWTEPDHGS